METCILIHEITKLLQLVLDKISVFWLKVHIFTSFFIKMSKTWDGSVCLSQALYGVEKTCVICEFDQPYLMSMRKYRRAIYVNVHRGMTLHSLTFNKGTDQLMCMRIFFFCHTA